MRRPQRLIAATLLIAFSGALGGCSSGLGAGFDPTDMLDWLDTKKKLPGDRKPVFPDGVPGMDQGVPKELYKGNAARQQQIEQQNAAVAAAPPPQSQQPQSQQPLEPPPGSKAALKKLKGKPQPATADQPAAEVDGEAASAGEPAADAAQPAPKPKKIVRKRITAPPPDQPAQQSNQSSSSAFPAPLPGGTFTR